MTDHEHSHGGGDQGGHSTNYVKVWTILVALLVVSVAGPFVGEALTMQWVTLAAAFGIAIVKAFLVIKHFMHVTIEKRVAHYILITSLTCVVLFFAGTAGDVMNHRGQNWENDAAKKVAEDGLKKSNHGEPPKKGH